MDKLTYIKMLLLGRARRMKSVVTEDSYNELLEKIDSSNYDNLLELDGLNTDYEYSEYITDNVLNKSLSDKQNIDLESFENIRFSPYIVSNTNIENSDYDDEYNGLYDELEDEGIDLNEEDNSLYDDIGDEDDISFEDMEDEEGISFEDIGDIEGDSGDLYEELEDGEDISYEGIEDSDYTDNIIDDTDFVDGEPEIEDVDDSDGIEFEDGIEDGLDEDEEDLEDPDDIGFEDIDEPDIDLEDIDELDIDLEDIDLSDTGDTNTLDLFNSEELDEISKFADSMSGKGSKDTSETYKELMKISKSKKVENKTHIFKSDKANSAFDLLSGAANIIDKAIMKMR